MDHPELNYLSKFMFGIIQNFSDPRSRQLALAVRIEQRGLEILNLKSEFSRCRVPRLVIDLEAWQSRDKAKNIKKKEIHSKEPEKDEEALEIELLETEKMSGGRKERGS